MRRKRRQNSAPVSLFAFQDIVTSVTGIILLVAMAMAIQVAKAPSREKAGISASEYGVLTERLQAIQTRLTRLQDASSSSDQELAEASSMSTAGAVEDARKLQKQQDQLKAQIDSLRQQLDDLTIQLAANEEALEASAGSEEAKRVADRLARVESELEHLKSSNRILFNPPDRASRRIHLAELFEDRALIATLDAKAPPTMYDGSSWLEDVSLEFRRRGSAVHWILFAHPGTTDELDELRDLLDKRGNPVGFDLLPNDVRVLDPITGAK